jgi:hypothetical protein
MGIAAEVAEYVFGAPERTLGVDHPFGGRCGGKIGAKSLGIAEWLKRKR